MKTDAVHLRDYVEQGSDDAFAELVRRYVNLVHGTAVRCVGGDRHQAEDVTQVVFTVLARQAGSLITHPVIAGWLHATTRFTASQTMRAARRRQLREQEAYVMNELCTPESSAEDWDRLRPVIDDAVAELSEPERDAILLRFFDGRKFSEIGAVLGASEDAVRMRVERALDKLRGALVRRGVTSTATALSTVLASHAAVSAPDGLVAKVLGTALVGAGDAISISGLFHAMGTAKGVVIVGTAAMVAVGFGVYQAHDVRTQEGFLTRELAELQTLLHQGEQRVAALESRLGFDGSQSRSSGGGEAGGESGDRPALPESQNNIMPTEGLFIPAELSLPGTTHAAFIIDTSGSMRDHTTGRLHDQIIAQVRSILETNPDIRFIQFLDADGRFMLGRAGKWLANQPSTSATVGAILGRYNVHSNSDPIAGINRAMQLPWTEDTESAKGSVIVLGDEFAGSGAAAALQRLELVNPVGSSGRRGVSINGVNFLWAREHPTGKAYSSLMERIAAEHGGAFVEAR